MKIEIEINDEELQKVIINKLADRMLSNYSEEKYERDHYGIKDAVKEVVYSQKNDLIDKCVERASKELVKKALPKLIDKIEE